MSKRTSTDSPSRDEESQSLLQTLDAVSPAPTNVTSASVPSVLDGSSSAAASGGNPILLAKMVLRKVLTIVVSDADESAPAGSDGYGPISLLKDVFVGTVFGLVTISMLIFMDREFTLITHNMCTFTYFQLYSFTYRPLIPHCSYPIINITQI